MTQNKISGNERRWVENLAGTFASTKPIDERTKLWTQNIIPGNERRWVTYKHDLRNSAKLADENVWYNSCILYIGRNIRI